MKILVAEDEPTSRLLLKNTLEKGGHSVEIACDGSEAWAALQMPDSPQLCVLDWVMPDIDGLELCRRIRESQREPYVYIILVTARGKKEDIVQGLQAGADDYIAKPFNLEELKVRVQTGCRLLRLQEELIRAREAYRQEATRDPLTGLWNRGAIAAILETELAHARRDQSSLAVALLDLDHFKKVNDQHGHLAGDAVLREVVRRVSAAVRGGDALGRYGGEEFLLVMPGCSSEAALAITNRLRDEVAATDIVWEEGIHITISGGVTALRCQRATSITPDSLIDAADRALYDAKRAGRDRVCFRPVSAGAEVSVGACT